MGPSVLSDITVRASGRVTKNSERGEAECAIFSYSNPCVNYYIIIIIECQLYCEDIIYL